MRPSVVALLFVLLLPGFRSHAQAVESAESHGLSISAGGMASGFNAGQYDNWLIGAGTFVDVRFTHWFQVEAEGRWLYWNQYFGQHESNYLIGPRVPIKQFGRSQLYGKALIGQGRQTFAFGYGYGSFTALAFGGTLDYRLSRRLTLRAADFEYQYWPNWINNESLHPYGFSSGVAYRVF
jgi:hypothetical protein